MSTIRVRPTSIAKHYGNIMPTKLHVLVIEDNSISQMITMAMLRELGITASIASDLAQARLLLLEEEFNAIMMDAQLPDGNGLDLTREYIEQGGKLPVIALTGTPKLSEYYQECMQAGMADYLEKPYTLKQLHESLLFHTSKS
ncbi:MAG: response regulator [Alphaproteobacteria bacterium]|nr:response regulator [Alphaproteobacteria bacterium]